MRNFFTTAYLAPHSALRGSSSVLFRAHPWLPSLLKYLRRKTRISSLVTQRDVIESVNKSLVAEVEHPLCARRPLWQTFLKPHLAFDAPPS